MTKEEYNLTLSNMQKEHRSQIENFQKEYAFANSRILLGNIIESGGIRIQVDSIGTFISIDKIPKCRYSGFAITKEGKQRKDQRRETIYQNDSIKIL